MYDFEYCIFLNNSNEDYLTKKNKCNYFVNMLNKMYVDKKELLVFEIDRDKQHIVKDFQDFQFYKRLPLLK